MKKHHCAAEAMAECDQGAFHAYDFENSDQCREEAQKKCKKSTSECERYDDFRLNYPDQALLPQCIRDGRFDKSHQVDHQDCDPTLQSDYNAHPGGYTNGNPLATCFGTDS